MRTVCKTFAALCALCASLPLFVPTPAVAQSHTLPDVGSLFCDPTGFILKIPSSSVTISDHTLWWVAAIYHYNSSNQETNRYWSQYVEFIPPRPPYFPQPNGWTLVAVQGAANAGGHVDADIYIYDTMDQQWWSYGRLFDAC